MAKVVGKIAVQASDKVLEKISEVKSALQDAGGVKPESMREKLGGLPKAAAVVTESKSLQEFTVKAKDIIMEHLSESKMDTEKLEAAFEAVLEVAQAAIKPAVVAVAAMVTEDNDISKDQFRVKLAPMEEQAGKLTLKGIEKDNVSKASPA